jgi:hypothetical protein
MARIQPNSFTQYELSEQEALQGSIFSLSQKMVIQNMLAEAAHRKLALLYDSTNHTRSMQEEAELTGKIGVLQELLEVSDLAEQTLKDQAEYAAQQQRQE